MLALAAPDANTEQSDGHQCKSIGLWHGCRSIELHVDRVGGMGAIDIPWHHSVLIVATAKPRVVFRVMPSKQRGRVAGVNP